MKAPRSPRTISALWLAGAGTFAAIGAVGGYLRWGVSGAVAGAVYGPALISLGTLLAVVLFPRRKPSPTQPTRTP